MTLWSLNTQLPTSCPLKRHCDWTDSCPETSHKAWHWGLLTSIHSYPHSAHYRGIIQLNSFSISLVFICCDDSLCIVTQQCLIKHLTVLNFFNLKLRTQCPNALSKSVLNQGCSWMRTSPAREHEPPPPPPPHTHTHTQDRWKTNFLEQSYMCAPFSACSWEILLSWTAHTHSPVHHCLCHHKGMVASWQFCC